jgi:hypothetical protein
MFRVSDGFEYCFSTLQPPSNCDGLAQQHKVQNFVQRGWNTATCTVEIVVRETESRNAECVEFTARLAFYNATSNASVVLSREFRRQQDARHL